MDPELPDRADDNLQLFSLRAVGALSVVWILQLELKRGGHNTQVAAMGAPRGTMKLFAQLQIVLGALANARNNFSRDGDLHRTLVARFMLNLGLP
jgi:hypothetical protein